MKLSARTLLVLGSVALNAGFFGGVARAEPPPESEGETDAALKATNAAPETQGLFALIGQALKDVELRPDQKTAVDALGAQVAPKQQAVDAARTDLARALAGDLSEGHIDRAALRQKLEALVAARQAERPALRSGLTSLHKLMTPEQRGAFVTSLEGHIQAIRAKSTAATTLEQWGKDLALTAEQKQEIKGMLDKGAENLAVDRDNAKRMFDAFRSDTFDPEKIVPERDADARSKERVANLETMTQTLAHVLTPEQRTKAAAKIREAFGANKSAPAAPGARVKSLDGADTDADEESVGATEDPIVAAGAARGAGWGYGGGVGAVGASRSVAVSSSSYGAAYSGGGMVL